MSLHDAILFKVMSANWLNQFWTSTFFYFAQIVMLIEEGANSSCHQLFLEYFWLHAEKLTSVFWMCPLNDKDYSKTIA